MNKKILDLSSNYKRDKEKIMELEDQLIKEREIYKERLRNSIDNSIEFSQIEINGHHSSKSKSKNKKYLASVGGMNQPHSGSKTSTSDNQQ